VSKAQHPTFNIQRQTLNAECRTLTANRQLSNRTPAHPMLPSCTAGHLAASSLESTISANPSLFDYIRRCRPAMIFGNPDHLKQEPK
jgi:hypothetical protein